MKSSELLLSKINCSSVFWFDLFEMVFDFFAAAGGGYNMAKLVNKYACSCETQIEHYLNKKIFDIPLLTVRLWF